MIFEEIYSIIKQRKTNFKDGSYCSSLFKDGGDKILQKIGEEGVELIIAGKNRSKKRIIEETADLFFMILALLVQKNISLNNIFRELENRRK